MAAKQKNSFKFTHGSFAGINPEPANTASDNKNPDNKRKAFAKALLKKRKS